jgi:hypothetical protein
MGRQCLADTAALIGEVVERAAVNRPVAGSKPAWRIFKILNYVHLKAAGQVGIAPTFPRLQRGANLPQLLTVG